MIILDKYIIILLCIVICHNDKTIDYISIEHENALH